MCAFVRLWVLISRCMHCTCLIGRLSSYCMAYYIETHWIRVCYIICIYYDMSIFGAWIYYVCKDAYTCECVCQTSSKLHLLLLLIIYSCCNYFQSMFIVICLVLPACSTPVSVCYQWCCEAIVINKHRCCCFFTLPLLILQPLFADVQYGGDDGGGG